MTGNKKILVVDDDMRTVELVKLYLNRDGYRVLIADDGVEALRLAREGHPDLIVLDLMLPGMDGLEICRTLRGESDVPIIMLTAKTTDQDKLTGLDLGADDYVTKPFSPKELAARVRTVLRRLPGERGPEEIKHGGDFGGEPSGSWIFPGISLCPDGIYAAAQIAAIASRQKLSELVDSIPGYPLLRGSVSSDGVVMSGLESRLMAMEPLSVSNIDGIKLNFQDGWLLIRASGTEPKIRLTAEAKSEARAQQLYDAGIRAIEESVDTGEKAN